jgi:hypothetical protein
MWTEKASAQSPELVQMLRRLLAADMLLAGRERQHEAALALGIDGLAGEPPGICRTCFSRQANRPT